MKTPNITSLTQIEIMRILGRPVDITSHASARSGHAALAAALDSTLASLAEHFTPEALPPTQSLGICEMESILIKHGITHNIPENPELTLEAIPHGLAYIQYGTPGNTGWIAVTQHKEHTLIFDPSWPISWVPKITWEHGVAPRLSNYLPLTILATAAIESPFHDLQQAETTQSHPSELIPA